jgi:archaellum biogenesis ATPase FlaH
MQERNRGLYDENKIRQAVNTLVDKGNVFEVRIIRKGRKGGISGYFKNADDLINAFDTVDLRNTNVYITLNAVDSACYDADQRDRFMDGVSTTSDTEIINYSWLFIDLDPKRNSKVSATKEEREAAYRLAGRVYNYLKNHNFEEPVKASSGNGAHLLYRVALKNTDENKTLIQNCLKALDVLFSNDDVDIDISTFNPSRICKLYGTMAQKGSDSAERPHRMSRIISVPEEIKVTQRVKLEWLASQFPQEMQQESRQYDNSHDQFDLERWLNEHGIGHSNAKTWKDGAVKYVLDECPFDHTHTAPDSCVIKQNNGAIGFKCLHNSCANKTWKDFRLMFEPDAYDKADRKGREIELGYQRHNALKAAYDTPYELDVQNPSDDMPIFIRATDVDKISSEPEGNYLATGYESIDQQINGLRKGCVSVLSGLRGAAKSTWLSQLMLNMVDSGQTVVCYSGELSSKNFFDWLILQAAGQKNVKCNDKFNRVWTVKDDEIDFKIREWLGDRFWLFNNEYGNRFSMLADVLRKQAEKVHADLIVLDNLMAVDLDYKKDDKYDAQTQFVWALKNIARQCNVHVIFVAHPRKASGFLRLDDISGTGNIGNIVDNAFIIHRANVDFWKSAEKFYGKDLYKIIPRQEQPNEYGNVIEICKNRENGIQDFFVPLWYESNTKRLNPMPNDNHNYSWLFNAAVETPLDNPW